MRVTFVGSGDAFGSGGRLQACILVDDGRNPLTLLDCGATSLVGLKRLGIDPSRIETAFVSHLFVDHFGGLPHLILDGQFNRRTRPLIVVGPLGAGERLVQAMDLMFPGSSTTSRRFPLDIIELAGDAQPVEIGSAVVRAWQVNHGMTGGPFLAFRITLGERTIAYTGDTAWTDALVAVADDADVLIAESYYWDKPVPFHLRHADLVAHRGELTSRRIVLTHMSGDMLEHAGQTPFELAHDGLVLDI